MVLPSAGRRWLSSMLCHSESAYVSATLVDERYRRPAMLFAISRCRDTRRRDRSGLLTGIPDSGFIILKSARV